MTKLLGFGAWRSPITSDLIVAETIGLSQLRVRGDETFWVESRPTERGRNVVVRHRAAGGIVDVNPAPFNARSRVHEYGGGAYLLGEDAVYFTQFDDQMLYQQPDAAGIPTRATNVAGLRFADGVYDRARRQIVTVCEDHSKDGHEPQNYLARVDLGAGGHVTPLVTGADFYATPRLSPDGNSIAWMSWNHPHMPWDGAELWVGQVAEDGTIADSKKIAGGGSESVYQPEWSPDGVLHFVSDPKGWWNIHRWTGSVVEPVLEMQAEFGRPLWTLGSATYGFGACGIVSSYVENGFWKLGLIDIKGGKLTPINIPYSAIFDLVAEGDRAIVIAGAPDLPTAVVKLDLSTGRHTVIKASSSVSIDPKYVSLPESIEFPTANGKKAFALFYPPKNDDFKPDVNELPPLVVKAHGGPTAATTAALNLNTQFWTSRGYAVVDVNYGGSTGYGTEYRNRLKEKWGVVDLDDAVGAAQYLSNAGRVDGGRMAISGGSAGGYTALCALAFRNVFQAGTSLYGISDLEALLRDTHKFEAKYPFWLIGPYPEARDRYRERSPVYFADKISAPVAFLQGEDDPVVPPSQTQLMADALLANGKLFGLIMFAGEQHGFRKSDTIRRALDAELDFYAVVLTKSGLRY
ncbi:MAG: prolyl oligopeptidase family serine peptidase [Methylocystis sp.]|uniref:S9 family peptidase n=1 Tax=Methylocystis sp. TaxID=1911079 RepID=UPI003DA60739